MNALSPQSNSILRFKPWRSDAYNENRGKVGDLNFGRLLILGESHYADDEDENFTSAVLQKFIEKRTPINFYRNLGLLFDPNDPAEIWKNVAFANVIQVPLADAKSQPDAEAISTIAPAFWELLASLQPKKILVCSLRLWNQWMPDEDERGTYIQNIRTAEKRSTIWQYNYSPNQSCLAMGIKHPSSYFSYEAWRELVFTFLRQE